MYLDQFQVLGWNQLDLLLAMIIQLDVHGLSHTAPNTQRAEGRSYKFWTFSNASHSANDTTFVYVRAGKLTKKTSIVWSGPPFAFVVGRLNRSFNEIERRHKTRHVRTTARAISPALLRLKTLFVNGARPFPSFSVNVPLAPSSCGSSLFCERLAASSFGRERAFAFLVRVHVYVRVLLLLLPLLLLLAVSCLTLWFIYAASGCISCERIFQSNFSFFFFSHSFDQANQTALRCARIVCRSIHIHSLHSKAQSVWDEPLLIRISFIVMSESN